MNLAALSGVTKAAAVLAVGGVLAGAIALGASGGKGGSSSPPAQVVAATATSVVEEMHASATPFVQEQQPVAPILASQGGRLDCPAEWLVWYETRGRLSICYPSQSAGNIEAVSYLSADKATDQVLWLHTPVGNRDLVPTALSMTVTVQTSPALATRQDCIGLVPGQLRNGTKNAFMRQGRSALSCEVDGEDFIQGRIRPLSVIVTEVPLEESFVVLVAHYQYAGPDKELSRKAVQAIIDTLTIR